MDFQTDAPLSEKFIVDGSNGACVKGRNDKTYWSWNVGNCFKMKTYLPLLPLKISILIWFSASSAVNTFYFVFLKNIGFSITEFTIFFTISPIVQMAICAVLGIISDKFAISKAVLMCSLLLTGLSAISLNLVPNLNSRDCDESNMLKYAMCTNHEFKNETIHCLTKLPNCKNVTLEVLLVSCLAEDSTCQVSNLTHIDTTFRDICDLRQRTKRCLEEIQQTIIANGSVLVCDQNSTRSCSVVCFNDQPKQCVHFNRTMLLSILFAIMIVYHSTFANSFRFFDVSSMILVKEHNSDYAWIRLWAACGATFSPLIVWLVVYYVSIPGQVSNYSSSFYVYAALSFMAAVSVSRMDVRASPGKRMWKQALMLLKNPDVLLFAFVIFVLGSTFGFFNTYQDWHLKEIGMPDYQFMLSDMIFCGIGLPVLLNSKWIFGRLGEKTIVTLALLTRCVTCVSYYWLVETWAAVLLELLAAFHYHLLWVTVIYFCIRVTPPDLVATFNAAMGSIHFLIGKITGSLLGGILISRFDSRTAFLAIGILNAATALIFLVLVSGRRICRK